MIKKNTYKAPHKRYKFVDISFLFFVQMPDLISHVIINSFRFQLRIEQRKEKIESARTGTDSTPTACKGNEYNNFWPKVRLID